ncbi:MAG: hypothetical protein QG672_770 [Pseudomonadota bacterium]|nr:hypothetical protein [Pseudomonadota bacterium]
MPGWMNWLKCSLIDAGRLLTEETGGRTRTLCASSKFYRPHNFRALGFSETL